MISITWIRAAPALLALAAATTAAAPEGGTPDQMAGEVFRQLQAARETAGSSRLERRGILDEVAGRRARLVASLPHEQRLSVPRSLGEDATEAGSGPFLRLKLHLDMSRGALDPASAFLRNWRRYDAWSTAMDPDFDAVGVGVARAEDGWTVLVAVLFQDMPLPDDLPALERATIAGVNAVRRQRGLPELIARDWLSAVARRHSHDMALRDYVGHKSPDGTLPADRVREAGRTYRKLAENIYMGSGVQDLAQAAIDGWMASRGHRKSIETPGFVETGLGVAIDDRGRVYFTQLFYTPAD